METLIKIYDRYSYGVPSGPIISALIISTRVSSTFKRIDESQATGRLVVRIASYKMNALSKPFTEAAITYRATSFAMASERLGISELINILASASK